MCGPRGEIGDVVIVPLVGATREEHPTITRLREIATEDPCAAGRCTDPAAHAEGAHDI